MLKLSNKLVTLLGNDDSRVDHCGEVVNIEISFAADLGEERIMGDPKVTKAMGDSSGLNPSNVVEVVMGDLSEKDQRDLELQHEMEEEVAERQKKKLTYFQKTRHGVVKKGDMMKASTPVNSLFTLEELVQMIDVSVNSKYGANMEGITRTLTDSVKGSMESLRLEFKQEFEKMPRQIRAMVQQVLGESREKRTMEGRLSMQQPWVLLQPQL
jgi:hypothetical protein